MAWTAPQTVVTGQVITTPIWNTELVDNLTTIKAYTDALNTAAMTVAPMGAGGPTSIGPIIQNGAKSRCLIAQLLMYEPGYNITILSSATSPPATIVAKTKYVLAAGQTYYAHIFALVPASYYYQRSADVNVAWGSYTDWDLY